MTANPVDLVYVDGVLVSKSDVRGFEKVRVRKRMADPNEIRNTDLSGQFAGIYCRSLQVDFDLDTGDATTPDDGVNCIVDFKGNRFKRIPLLITDTQRKVVVAGPVAISADDADIIVIAKMVGEATTANLPAAASKEKSVKIVDGKGDAATNNITIVPVSGETIMGTVDYQYVIDSNGGSVRLTPLADGTGWIV